MLPTIENVKNIFHIPASKDGEKLKFAPYFFLEARIDFSDVRTGFRETYNPIKVVAIPLLEMEPLWEEEDTIEFDLERIKSDAPEQASFENLPEHVSPQFITWIESQFLQYLLGKFTVRIYRNYNLGVYSVSGETLNDFIIRCVELIHGPMCREFDSIHEVFKRKLERLQRKYLSEDRPEDDEALRKESRNRELLNRIAERISALFLRTESSIQCVRRPEETVSTRDEFEERLQALHSEAQEAVAKILDTYEESAKSVDEYILHPTMKNIHFVRCFILWKPEGA